MNDAHPCPERGDDNATSIYLAVGIALSWWEALEDVLVDCFVVVCGAQEPTSLESYLAADRQRRFNMLKSACRRYRAELPAGVADRIVDLAKKANELAQVRNQIAHGRCENTNTTVDDKVVMSGHYLVPSKGYPWTLGDPRPRYAHTTETIGSFTSAARRVRSDLLDLHKGLLMGERFQSALRNPETSRRLFVTK